MTPEGKAVAKIQKWLLSHEGDCFKVHGNMYQRSGEPDLTGSIKYLGVWLHYKLEVKAPKGESSRGVDPLQIVRLRHWHSCAKVVGVVRSVYEVEILFDAHVDYINGEDQYDLLWYLDKHYVDDEYKLYKSGEWEH